MTSQANSRLSGSPASVLVRCDGSADIGLGHIVRCLALAEELRERHAATVRFLVRRGPPAVRMAEQAGFSVEQPADEQENDADWISRALLEQKADALVMDFRAGLSQEAVWQWRRQGVLMVTLDDPEEKRIACDLVFSPPVPQVRRVSWEGFTGELHAGWEWVLLRRQFANVSRAARQNSRPVVLVAMGGSDPAGLTLKAVRALDSMDEEFDAIVIVGGAFCHNQALEEFLRAARRRFEIRRNVSNMAEVMAGADLAVASFCVTAYELAAIGVPAIFLCLTEDHAESASAFVKAGMGVSLGVHTLVTGEEIATAVRRLTREETVRNGMSHACRRFARGDGAANIARNIMTTLKAAYARS